MSTLKRNHSPRVQKRTLTAVITSQLRRRIEDGTYPPGTQLSEVELATQFATSRGPVREALQWLIQEGLLVSEPHRGVFVPRLTDDDLDDLYFARSAIERAAMLRLVERSLPAATQASLEQILAEMELAFERDDWSSVSRADLEFHQTIVDAVASPRLTHMYGSLASQTRLGLNLLLGTYEGRSDYVEAHARLLALLSAGDRQELLAELDAHFGQPLSTLRETHGSPDTSQESTTTGA